MKRNHIFRMARVMTAALTVGVLTLACSDWDDHYDADITATGTASSNLWENISSNAELSQFTALLQKTGYDKVLAESQTYTVWAPKDNTFDYNYYNSISTDKLLREFVLNHISRYNYAVADEKTPTIYMLNEKAMNFTSGQIGGVSIAKTLGTSNGVLQMLDGKLPFLYNIYESLEPGDFAIDSISNYYHSYDIKVLNTAKSVQGPVVDGQITYLDSVFDESNRLYPLYYAYINREDSNYTMIVPTNEAWTKAKETVSKYFNYVDKFTFLENTGTGTYRKETPVEIDATYLRDSMINYMVMKDLFYNNNLYDNEALNTLQTGQTLRVDSLVGTSYALSGRSTVYSEDAANLFEGAVRVDKSNGAIFVTDSLRMRTWTSWNPPIKVEGENTSYMQSQNVFNSTATATYVTTGTQNPAVKGKLSGNGYMLVTPNTTSTNPDIYIYIPHVRSAVYNIYCVIVPEHITNTYLSEDEVKKNRIKARIGYNETSGSIKDYAMAGYVENDPTKIDTVFVGEFEFPIAYEGTGEYYPYIRLQSQVSSSLTNTHTRTIRLDCLLLIPKELDEYRKAHPDYKYYEGSGYSYY
ncbi:MAG: fasciclin domain-containing protein [Prevotella sp.]|nr:fasciclin domain-containing protein [Prevotella sp.]